MNSDTSQDTLNNKERITLGLLNAVQGNNAVTQRILASHLGVALGLPNSYLTPCAKKGLIKISQAPSNRYIYYLTPHGFGEKDRLTAEYLKQSFYFFRIARGQSKNMFRLCDKNAWRRVALIGKTDLIEIAILSAAEISLELAGIVYEEAAQSTDTFMNIPVVGKLPDLRPVPALVLTDTRTPQNTFEEIIKFFPKERVLTMPILSVRRNRVDEEES